MSEAPKTSLEYLRNKKTIQENVKNEVDFLSADKCQMFPQIAIIILDVCGKVCPNCPK